MLQRETTGRGPVRPSCTCTRRFHLLDLNSGNCLNDKVSLVPADTEKNAEVWLGADVLLARRRSRQPGCFASGESRGIIRRGKFTFPSDVPGLSWARSPQTFRHPSAAGGACFLSPASSIAYWDARDEIPCRRSGGAQPPAFPFVRFENRH